MYQSVQMLGLLLYVIEELIIIVYMESYIRMRNR